jgi:Bifunctional DNA primase/polymerase, N-terminal
MTMSLIDAALELAEAGWPVFPCTGKAPLTEHGFKDGTTDPDRVASFWRRWPQANIAARIPEGLVVLDVDPRHGGDQSLKNLESEHGVLPSTLRTVTGGGGLHIFFQRPPWPIRNGNHKLGRGIDVKAPGKGYVILPPSGHESGRRYAWDDPTVPISVPPAWLAELLRPDPVPERPSRAVHLVSDCGERPGDLLERVMSWEDILLPAGWRLARFPRGEINYWTRPGKSGGTSATTNALGTDRFYVFSSSAAPFEPDTSYSKFAAWALLNTGGDLSQAARQIRREVLV